MVNFAEEKALENDQWLYSLENEILGVSRANFDRINSMKGYDNDDRHCGIDDESNALIDRKAYWKSQISVLEEVLTHNSLSGNKLRRTVKKGLEMMRDTDICTCSSRSKSKSVECMSCLRRAIVKYLYDRGFDAAFCTSKWRPTRKLPGGTHDYIDVIIKNPGRKHETRYWIELEFESEFKIAKACEEYQKLTSLLPEIYVGKLEHLNAIVTIVSNAAKKSMKENKFYMGPWRRKTFMQMKWFGPYVRISPSGSSEDDLDLSNQGNTMTIGFYPNFAGDTPMDVI